MLILINPWKMHVLFLPGNSISSTLLEIPYHPPFLWQVSRFPAWCKSDSLTVTVTACSDIPISLKSLFILLLSSRFMGHSLPNLIPTFIFQHFAACGKELTAPL